MTRSSLKRSAVSYLMMFPWLLAFGTLTLIPILTSVGFSFTYYNMLQSPRWIGFSNYLRLFLEDDVFLIAIRNTILFALITGPLGYLVSFFVAWLINDLRPRIRAVLTLLFYAPTLAGNVYFIWLLIFSSDSYGLLNSRLLQIGIIRETIFWLTDPRYNMVASIVVLLWLSLGAGFLAFVAGFQQLNPSLFEAGAIDGIRNRFQELRHITLPQMIPQLLIGAILAIAGAFAVGYQLMALTGFPSTDYSTHTVVLHIYDFGYLRFEMGYASAIAVILFIVMASLWHAINRRLGKVNS